MTVLLSAYIRLAEVGVGCETWPDCYAILHPDAQQKGIAVLTDSGRDMAYRGARLAHRYIASILGLFIFAVFAVSVRRRHELDTGLTIPSALLAITLFLSVLGYYTPSRDIPMITMGNLLGGMAMLGLLWWMMQRNTERVTVDYQRGDRHFALIALGLVTVQIVLGGWSSANYASTACAELLSCESPWFGLNEYAGAFNPTRTVELESDGRVVRDQALGALSMSHRGFALLTAAYLAWLVRKLKTRPQLKASALAMSVFSIGLIVAGVSMIWLEMPLLLVSLHNALAAGLLISSVQLLHRLTPHPQALQ
jgi:cytochrome c oxidase assembly protein subunit 15